MMKKITIITIIFLIFGGCTSKRQIVKTQSETKIQNNIESATEFNEVKTAIKAGKSTVNESSTVEEITIKKTQPIELTANFRIDSSATLRGDTALKLVDVADKNISVTIYQNGKTNLLTAKIRNRNSVEDIPFTEISIKNTNYKKSTLIDTTMIEDVKSSIKTDLKDKSKVIASTSKVEKDKNKVNYIGLVVLYLLSALVLWFIFRK